MRIATSQMFDRPAFWLRLAISEAGRSNICEVAMRIT